MSLEVTEAKNVSSQIKLSDKSDLINCQNVNKNQSRYAAYLTARLFLIQVCSEMIDLAHGVKCIPFHSRIKNSSEILWRRANASLNICTDTTCWSTLVFPILKYEETILIIRCISFEWMWPISEILDNFRVEVLLL